MTNEVARSKAGDSEAVAVHIENLWRRTLKRDTFRRDDHFAELGGDSLLLLAIMAELEEAYDIELDVDAFVEKLTVNGMAEAVVEARTQ